MLVTTVTLLYMLIGSVAVGYFQHSYTPSPFVWAGWPFIVCAHIGERLRERHTVRRKLVTQAAENAELENRRLEAEVRRLEAAGEL